MQSSFRIKLLTPLLSNSTLSQPPAEIATQKTLK